MCKLHALLPSTLLLLFSCMGGIMVVRSRFNHHCNHPMSCAIYERAKGMFTNFSQNSKTRTRTVCTLCRTVVERVKKTRDCHTRCKQKFLSYKDAAEAYFVFNSATLFYSFRKCCESTSDLCHSTQPHGCWLGVHNRGNGVWSLY